MGGGVLISVLIANELYLSSTSATVTDLKHQHDIIFYG